MYVKVCVCECVFVRLYTRTSVPEEKQVVRTQKYIYNTALLTMNKVSDKRKKICG